MARTDLYKDSFNNIKKYVDDLFHKIQKGTGDMLKSVYDKNNNGKVDISESVSLDQKPQSVTETDIKFGVDADGKWGYIKGGADTVIPFKGDPNLQTKSVYPYGGTSTDEIVVTHSPQTEYPSGNPLDLGNARIGKLLSPYEVMADEGYDGLYLVTIQPPELQSKTVNPTKTQQIIGPDTDYVALGSVTVNAYPDPTLQSKSISPTSTQQVITADSGYDGLSSVTVGAAPEVNLQSNKTVSPTTSQQIVTPDSGYDGLEQVTVNAANLQARTVTPSLQEQVITPQSFPGSTYIGLSQVTVEAIENKGTLSKSFAARSDVTYNTNGTYTMNARAISGSGSGIEGYYEGYRISDPQFTITVDVPGANLQSKSVSGMTPSANWSGAYTSAYSISPDSGYDGMSSVSVTVPMVRDYSLFTVSTVETPSTVYNGDTAQSNSTKMLRIAPTKTGMVYTNSYLELGPSSYMGNATAADVLSGKTFSSSNGIQLTGTNPGGSTPTGNINLGTISSNGSKTGYNVSGYATCSFTVSVPQPSGTYSYGSITTNGSKTINIKDYEYISFTVNVPTGGSIQSRKDADLVRYDSTTNVQPDTGYDGIRYVGVPSLKSCMVNLWSNSSSSSAFAGQTVTLSKAWTLFSAIIIYYRPHKDNTSGYYYSVLLEYSTINAHNSTSTAKFALCGRASTSASATSGSMVAEHKLVVLAHLITL